LLFAAAAVVVAGTDAGRWFTDGLAVDQLL